MLKTLTSSSIFKSTRMWVQKIAINKDRQGDFIKECPVCFTQLYHLGLSKKPTFIIGEWEKTDKLGTICKTANYLCKTYLYGENIECYISIFVTVGINAPFCLGICNLNRSWVCFVFFLLFKRPFAGDCVYCQLSNFPKGLNFGWRRVCFIVAL